MFLDRDVILKETIEIICKSIGAKWKELAENLFHIEKETLQQIEGDDDLSYEAKLRRCFTLVKDNIRWTKVKNSLILAEAKEIISAASSTLLTESMRFFFFIFKEIGIKGGISRKPYAIVHVLLN